MTRYAENTQVSSDRSRAEIESTLARYGADRFMYAWHKDRAVVGFSMAGRQVRFVLPLPDRNDEAFTHTPSKRQRRQNAVAANAYEQAVRQRWRALALAIKAKLEAVDSGITVFDAEFLAHIVLPDGQTVGQAIAPQIETSYSTGNMPPLLPDYSSPHPKGE